VLSPKIINQPGLRPRLKQTSHQAYQPHRQNPGNPGCSNVERSIPFGIDWPFSSFRVQLHLTSMTWLWNNNVGCFVECASHIHSSTIVFCKTSSVVQMRKVPIVEDAATISLYSRLLLHIHLTVGESRRPGALTEVSSIRTLTVAFKFWSFQDLTCRSPHEFTGSYKSYGDTHPTATESLAFSVAFRHCLVHCKTLPGSSELI